MPTPPNALGTGSIYCSPDDLTQVVEHLDIVLILAVIFGLYMAWAIGANDVANAMATSVGSGAVPVIGAICIAAVFEFLGAYLAGGEVTSTIRKSIIDVDLLANDPNICPTSRHNRPEPCRSEATDTRPSWSDGD